MRGRRATSNPFGKEQAAVTLSGFLALALSIGSVACDSQKRPQEQSKKQEPRSFPIGHGRFVSGALRALPLVSAVEFSGHVNSRGAAWAIREPATKPVGRPALLLLVVEGSDKCSFTGGRMFKVNADNLAVPPTDEDWRCEPDPEFVSARDGIVKFEIPDRHRTVEIFFMNARLDRLRIRGCLYGSLDRKVLRIAQGRWRDGNGKLLQAKPVTADDLVLFWGKGPATYHFDKDDISPLRNVTLRVSLADMKAESVGVPELLEVWANGSNLAPVAVPSSSEPPRRLCNGEATDYQLPARPDEVQFRFKKARIDHVVAVVVLPEAGGTKGIWHYLLWGLWLCLATLGLLIALLLVLDYAVWEILNRQIFDWLPRFQPVLLLVLLALSLAAVCLAGVWERVTGAPTPPFLEAARYYILLPFIVNVIIAVFFMRRRKSRQRNSSGRGAH